MRSDIRRGWLRVALVVVFLAVTSTGCRASTDQIAPLAAAPSVENDAAPLQDSPNEGPSERGEVDETDEARFTISAALQEIPMSVVADASGFVQFSAADVDAAAELAGIRRPSDPSDATQLFDFLAALTGLPRDGEPPPLLFVPFPQTFAQRPAEAEAMVAELGFTAGDITSFAAVESPPAQFVVVTGPAVVDGLPEVVPGVRTIGQGEDFEVNVEDRSPSRQLGRPLRVGAQDDRTAFSLATTPIIDWMTGPSAGTLADDPVFASIAGRLDEEGAVSALILSSEAAYDGVGLGWTSDASGARGVIVFAHTTPAEANQWRGAVEDAFASESLVTREPLSEMVTLDSLEVRGTQVVATVRFPNDRSPHRLFQMPISNDRPFSEAPAG